MYDLSFVTDALRNILTDGLSASPAFGNPPPFSLGISSQHPSDAPDAPTNDCDINLYLFHIAEDRGLRNQFWTQKAVSNQGAMQPVAFEPLCLDLYYLLTAHSQTSYNHEQLAMSVGMRAFHENPIVRLPTPTPTGLPQSEITLSMETATWDELSRLWQALECPMRMTALYKASVAMLMPEGAPHDTKPVDILTVLGAPATASDGSSPELIGTVRTVKFESPAGPRTLEQSPASFAPAAAGQAFTLRGTLIEGADTVFLISYAADGTRGEQDITTWKYGPHSPGAIGLAPSTAPAECPAPGRYALQLGRPASTWRSNEVPVSIAPWIDPAGVLELQPAGGVYTCSVRNVPAAGVEVRLGTVELMHTGGAPGPGEWSFTDATREQVQFSAPAMPAGTYPVRLRVADIEADPAKWVIL